MGVARFDKEQREAHFSGTAVLYAERGIIVAPLNGTNLLAAPKILDQWITAAISNSAGSFEGTPGERGLLIEAIHIVLVLLIQDIRFLHEDPSKIHTRTAFRVDDTRKL
ncbi:MAG TPA: hypothetical protein VFG51_03130 [Candidatus Saccharimonadia bacterium]|nr:hypothetical protein [Candidatus Saccharimonadia bacterium]